MSNTNSEIVDDIGDPTGPLDPLNQCLRCGYWISTPEARQGIVIHGPGGDILRYGPDFIEHDNVEVDIDEEALERTPISMCSINCALDSLSNMFKDDAVMFTAHCVLLGATYSVQIPGLPINPQNPKKYIIDKSSLGKNPKLLKRWGGTIEYGEFRKDFICPPCPYTADMIDKARNEVRGRHLPEDDQDNIDPVQYYDPMAEAHLLDTADTEPIESGDYDYIPREFRAEFPRLKKSPKLKHVEAPENIIKPNNESNAEK